MKETYKDIVGYEGYYKVSNFGNIKSLISERLLKPDVNKHGYCRVKLHKSGSVKRFLVHRLVAAHFIDNSESKSQVNHIDNNPSNNHISNLEWCTPSENMQHSMKQGRQDKVTKIASKAMAEANLLRSKIKYDSYIGTNINGRILLSYFKKGKHYKGNFRCYNCGKEFTAYLDSSLRNINRGDPLYCRSCTMRRRDSLV